MRARFAALLVAGLLIAAASSFAQEDQPTRTAGVATCSGDVADASNLLAQQIDNTGDLMGARNVPRFVRQDYADSVALSDLQQHLNEAGAAALLFGHAGATHCVYLVDRSGIVAFGAWPDGVSRIATLQASWRADIGVEQVTRGVRAGVPKRGLVPEAAPASTPDAAALALNDLAIALLPGDVRARLRAFTHVYVIPYAGIGAVPFLALPSGDGKQLIDYAAFSIVPAAEVMLGEDVEYNNVSAVRARADAGYCSSSGAASGPALVVGDPEAAGDPDWSFPRLAGAASEARDVARLLAVDPLTGAGATREAFVDRAREAAIVHVASHGVASEDDPLSGFLALADGRLSAAEVQRACIPARLVVLSACQTGLGRAHEGGVIGLARAFQIAGADEVIMSLWSVDDAATNALMVDFWTTYHQSANAPEALRQAALRLRARRPDVRLWAPFMVFGVPETVRQVRSER